MPAVSVEELLRLCKKDRRTIQRRLDDAGVPVKLSGKRKNYDSAMALEAIYQVDAATASDLTLQEARTHEAVAKTAKIDLEREILEKTRIPIDVVEQEVGNVLAELKAVAKRHLDRPGQTEFFAACAKIPAKLGFCGE